MKSSSFPDALSRHGSEWNSPQASPPTTFATERAAAPTTTSAINPAVITSITAAATPAPTPAANPATNPTAVSTQIQASTSNSSEQTAIRLYPPLGVVGSTFNTRFLALRKKYAVERPAYFRDPDWPVTLAREVAKSGY